MTSKTIVYNVQGMHCKACEMLLEGELATVPEVQSINADLSSKKITVITDSQTDRDALAQTLTKIVGSKGYSVHVSQPKESIPLLEFSLSLRIAAILIVGFALIQRLGFANFTGQDSMSLPVAFGIGLIASVSSCMAVVGGLLLSVSATWAKQESAASPEYDPSQDGQKSTKLSKVLPHILFHISRLVAFFVLGGVLGLIGGLFTLTPVVSTIINLLVAVLMLILAINLLDIPGISGQLQLTLPKTFTRHWINRKVSGIAGPMVLGLITFFLPCGFTQSMQVFALSVGSFLEGGAVMLAFALGTLPMLAIISVSSFRFSSSRYGGIFFKTAGFLVAAFALFNLYNGLQVLRLFI